MFRSAAMAGGAVCLDDVGDGDHARQTTGLREEQRRFALLRERFGLLCGSRRGTSTCERDEREAAAQQRFAVQRRGQAVARQRAEIADRRGASARPPRRACITARASGMLAALFQRGGEGEKRALASCPSAGSTSVTRGSPWVMVPVLSSATISVLPVSSSEAAVLNRMPFFAPRPLPTMMATGVASPSAHGQLMTSTEMPRASAKPTVWPQQQPDDGGHDGDARSPPARTRRKPGRRPSQSALSSRPRRRPFG